MMYSYNIIGHKLHETNLPLHANLHLNFLNCNNAIETLEIFFLIFSSIITLACRKLSFQTKVAYESNFINHIVTSFSHVRCAKIVNRFIELGKSQIKIAKRMEVNFFASFFSLIVFLLFVFLSFGFFSCTFFLKS